MKIVGIDLNDVLMDNAGNFELLFGGKITLDHLTKWDSELGHLVGMPNKEFLDICYNTPATQLLAEPHAGAAARLRELKEAGYVVNIVTATCMSISQIETWLNRYGIQFDNIIRAKSKVGPNLLIDDNPKTIEERMSLGLPTIKFERPWNTGVDCPSISKWADLEVGRYYEI